MSRNRVFPIYTVRTQDDVGCGHQHSFPQVAENCANNMLTRDRSLQKVVVLRIRQQAKSNTLQQRVVKTIEQPVP